MPEKACCATDSGWLIVSTIRTGRIDNTTLEPSEIRSRHEDPFLGKVSAHDFLSKAAQVNFAISPFSIPVQKNGVTRKGVLIISLDYESYWGVRDKLTLKKCRKRLLGERRVIGDLLELFQEYGIHCTWAIVGFLFAETRDELLAALPNRRPQYQDPTLSPYSYLNKLGKDEHEDPFHYGASLIALIAATPHQEVGTHTFSHYYCLEKGQDADAFRADLDAAIGIAGKRNFRLESMVFPRNQCNGQYLRICKEAGIKAYRGNERSWIYRPKSKEEETLLRRGVRLLDAYLPIAGRNSYGLDNLGSELPFNIPSSRFFRPFSSKLRILEPLRISRIRSELRYAAKNGLIYHLWWHPHNFGDYTDENFRVLKTILNCFRSMKEDYGMESLTMSELAQRQMALNEKNGTWLQA